MKKEDLNRGWSFQKGSPMLMMALATGSFGRKVNLPHDYMIESDVRADAPAGAAMGYYTEGGGHLHEGAGHPGRVGEGEDLSPL